MRPLDPNATAWFEKAEEDLKVGRLVLNADPPFAATACYHAQQCAEKCLKGYLVAHRVVFKHVHELGYLVRLCAGVNPRFAELIGPATELQDYATDVRYPSFTIEPVTRQDALEALARAKQIRDLAARSLE